MKENFIDTISISQQPYIFRYELDSTNSTYNITIINRRDFEPFSMAMSDSQKWSIVNNVSQEIKQVEDILNRAILSNNTQP